MADKPKNTLSKPKTRETPKKLLFAAEFVVDQNATAAYRRAGYRPKSDATASVEACKLLKDPEVQKIVQKEMKKLVQKTGVDAEWVVRNLVRVYRRAMASVAETDKDGNPTGHYRFDGKTANRSLELLGKHIGMFEERFRMDLHTTEEKKLTISDLGLSLEVLRELESAARKKAAGAETVEILQLPNK